MNTVDDSGLPSADEESREPVAIPHTELSAEALRGVIDSFILREGTDYGECEFSLEQKVTQVQRQLHRGEARILFDPVTATVTIERVPGR